MTENFIQISTAGTVNDEFAREEDKKKAYQIFALSAVASVILTAALYIAATTLF